MAYLGLLVHLGLLDVQVTQDKDLLDHQGLQGNQVMEDQGQKEKKEMWATHPALEHFILDLQDLLGSPDLKEQQVCLDPVDTQVNKVHQVSLGSQEDQEALLLMEEMGFRDHQVPQDLLDAQEHLE